MFFRLFFPVLLAAISLPSHALTCGVNQQVNTTTNTCECVSGMVFDPNNPTTCITMQAYTNGMTTRGATSVTTGNINNSLQVTQGDQQTDTKTTTTMGGMFGGSNPGLGLTGYGNSKLDECKSYVPDPQNPNPRKDAECAAVNELAKNQVTKYIASTGLDKKDAAFGGAAYKAAQASPYQVLGVDKTTLQATTSGSCVTTVKTTPNSTADGQCIKTAAPDTTRCTQRVVPTAYVEKYCDVTGSGSSRGFGYRLSNVGDRIYPGNTPTYTINYSCLPPDPVTGPTGLVTATVQIISGGWGGRDCPNGAGSLPYSFNFYPGISSSQQFTFMSACSFSWGGWMSGGSMTTWNATVWYDGPSDTVYVTDTNKDGSYTSSCVNPGDAFVPSQVVTGPTICTGTGYGQTCKISDVTIPASCVAPGVTIPAPTTLWASATCTRVQTGYNRFTNNMTCPTGYVWTGGNTFNYNCSATPTIPNGCVQYTCPTPFSLFTYYDQNYRYGGACYLPNTIKEAAPFDHYTGGAGLRTRLTEKLVETTPSCADLQKTNPTSGPNGAGTYAPKVTTVYSCDPKWTLVETGASGPYCSFQAPVYGATKTTTFSCIAGTVSGTNCNIQEPNYNAFSTDIYSCATGDSVTASTCTGGKVIGNSCQYQSIRATATSTCGTSGLFPVGALCYTNASYASTLTYADNINAFTPSSVGGTTNYSCPTAGYTTLAGTECRPSPKTVTCDHQRPDYYATELQHFTCPTTGLNAAGSNGGFPISYTPQIPDTNKTGMCVANEVTKPSSLLGYVCPTSYTWNAATTQCELQMPDYSSTISHDCSGMAGYTYDTTLIACTYAAQ